MQCSHPVALRGKTEGHEVPCGRCIGCRIARARELATRCVHEAAYWPGSAFTTLTYRDEDLPANASLDKAEFTRFLKRLRKSLGDRRIRYYGCGEYGERTGRPHYHVLLFGMSPCTCSVRLTPDVRCHCVDRRLVFDAWGHGGVDRLGTVNYDSARYCADYIGKAFLGKGAADHYAPRSVPFQVMSQGIGRSYVDDHAEQLRDNLGITVHGKPVGLPRYYSNRLEVDWTKADTEGVLPSRRKYTAGFQSDEVCRARGQHEKDLLARVHMFKKEKV